MELSANLHNDIVDFLTSLPNIHDHNSRRALIQSAALDAQLQCKIDFNGPSEQFFQLLIPTLRNYGKLTDDRDPIEAVLEAAQNYVGNDRQAKCEALIQQLREYPPPQHKDEKPLQPPRRTSQIRSVLKNVVVGMCVFMMMLWFQHRGWLQCTQNVLMDFLMRISQGEALQTGRPIPPLIFLDIDEETYQDWGKPQFARGRLLQLIQTVVKANASVIVVDIRFDRQTPVDGQSNPQTLHPDDQKLYDYLANYSKLCQVPDRKRFPQIILLQTFQKEQANNNTDVCLHLNATFLDPAVKNSLDVHWGTGLRIVENDQVIRWLYLWQPACSATGEAQVIPSIQLLSAAFVLQPGQDLKNIPAAILQSLYQSIPKNCTTECLATEKLKPPLRLGQDDQYLLLTSIQQRILYKIPWKAPFAKELAYTRYPARLITQALDRQQPLDLAGLNNAIVIIGGSFSDIRDIHITPLGDSPGSLIILNAIYSLLQYGELPTLPVAVKLLLAIVLLLISSLVFVHWQSVQGIIFVSVIVDLLCFTIFLLLYQQGWWVESDLLIPLVVVQVYQLAVVWRKNDRNKI